MSWLICSYCDQFAHSMTNLLIVWPICSYYHQFAHNITKLGHSTYHYDCVYYNHYYNASVILFSHIPKLWLLHYQQFLHIMSNFFILCPICSLSPICSYYLQVGVTGVITNDPFKNRIFLFVIGVGTTLVINISYIKSNHWCSGLSQPEAQFIGSLVLNLGYLHWSSDSIRTYL